MITIGLMLTQEDSFSLRRADLLVGPMVLEGAIPIRFSNQDIHPVTLQVTGEVYSGNSWHGASPLRPDVILDLTKPFAARNERELSLLAQTPHSKRIDLDHLELLQLLARDEEFKQSTLPVQPLKTYEDVMQALGDWGAIIIKKRTIEQGLPSLVIEPMGDNWRVSEPYRSETITELALKSLVEPRLNRRYFMQKFIQSVGAQGHALMALITVQQRGDMAWMKPTVHCIVATEGPFASLAAGGQYLGPPFIKNASFPPIVTRTPAEAGKLNWQLQSFAVCLARRVEELVEGHPSALAIKVGISNEPKPYLMDLDIHPAAPCRPARSLEFYRHLTNFAIGLTQLKKPSPTRRLALTGIISHPQHPTGGISIRHPISQEEIASIFQCAPKWIDLSLGHGGRDMLCALRGLVADNNPRHRPLLSLRLGNALNDFSQGITLTPPHLIAIEEYIGRGVIRWPEAQHMRSMRVPLLQLQFDQAMAVLLEYKPNIIWIEDLDLGLHGIAPGHHFEEIERTVNWLEQLCLDGHTQSWGVTLFNCKPRAVIQLIGALKSVAGPNGHFSHVGGRSPLVDKASIASIIKENIQFVLTTQQVGDREEPAEAEMNGVTVLTEWRGNR